MALKGTLKDFGIAEILQLIGQQAKSGVLHLESRDDVIHIAMADGSVVRAESAGRKAREKLGMLLVRADLITQAQLDHALDLQKRTLRRLGDILVELGYVTVAQLREMTALQTTETVYKLFHWKSGTYAFEPGDVEWDPETVTPVRAESVLMEGFRQVDEWPLVRKRISSPEMTFERLRAPEPERARTGPLDRDVDGPSTRSGRGRAATLDGERPGRPGAGAGRAAGLRAGAARPDRRADRRPLAAGRVRDLQGAAEPGQPRATCARWRRRGRGAARSAPTPATCGTAPGPGWCAARPPGPSRSRWPGWRSGWTSAAVAVGDGGGGVALRDNVAPRFLARYQLARLRGALEVYRVEKGQYPERLEELVEVGLVSPRDLRHPWSQPYHYRRRPDGGFVLLSPVE